MNRLFASLTSVMLGPIQRRVGRVARIAPFVLTAFVCIVASLGFFSVALYISIKAEHGAVTAALIVASGYGVIALIAAAVALWLGRDTSGEAAISAGRLATLATPDAVAEAVKAVASGSEQAALLAGLQIANKLKPFELIGLAMVAGFVAGRRMRRDKNLTSKKT